MILSNLFIMYFGTVFFKFPVLEIYWPSWIWVYSLYQTWTFSGHFSCHTIPPSGTLISSIGYPTAHWSYLKYCFFFYVSLWIISLGLSSSSLIFSSAISNLSSILSSAAFIFRLSYLEFWFESLKFPMSPLNFSNIQNIVTITVVESRFLTLCEL